MIKSAYGSIAFTRSTALLGVYLAFSCALNVLAADYSGVYEGQIHTYCSSFNYTDPFRVAIDAQGNVVPDWTAQGVLSAGRVQANGSIAGLSITINSRSRGQVSIPYNAKINGATLSGSGKVSEFVSTLKLAKASPPAVTSPLELEIVGQGTLKGATDGQLLEVGRSYTVTASPGTGYLFEDWRDGAGVVLSTGAKLTFVMREGLALQARFVPNPFAGLKGTYNGLFYPGLLSYTSVSNSGPFTLTLTERGGFSGKLTIAGTKLSFSGSFGADLRARLSLARKGQEPLEIELELQPEDASLWGSLSTDSALSATRAATASSNLFAGRYTVLISSEQATPNAPPGYGAATVVVSSTGTARLTGALADGTTIAHNMTLDAQGRWPVFVPLYKNQGLFLGWFAAGTESDSTEAYWVKPAAPGDRYHKLGFQERTEVLVVPYIPPAVGVSPFDWTTGSLELGGGNLAAPTSVPVQNVNGQIRVTDGSIANLVFSIKTADGTFSGSFRHPVTRAKTSFKGVCVPMNGDFAGPWTWAAGWFLGKDEAGAISLSLF